LRKSRRAKCALHWHSPEQKMPIFVSTGLGHCLSQLSQTISLRMATSSIDVKLERLGLDWDHFASLMLPSWLSGDGPCTAPLRPRVGASPSGTATACFATAAGAPPVRSSVLQPVATAGPVRSADDEAYAFTGAARSSPCAEPPSEPCDWSRCPIPCAERSVEAVSLESDDSERRKMGTGGVPAAAVTVVSPSGGSGIHGPSRKPARRAVSLPIISVSWRRESESFTAFRAVAASITFGKDAGFRRKTGVASLDPAPKPSIRTGAARAAIGRRATRAQPAPTKQTCGKRTRGGVGVGAAWVRLWGWATHKKDG